ncbi:NUDIX hydrolase [Myxococcus sp. CA051A]|uniref:NUDIX hydrolase n=1 Tax=unclassified Myxococcus TaxID=2648731 RepID=UPI00157B4252|nr:MULTISPECIES: NUDIX hydrolase [unclassified Myxococcus]NTX37333.1 NUDIX hydrolase [Myxococcus sp. CA033]NTX66119.1 NUDIX hydrolase [Myxococcus sp. CA051A]
MSGGAAWRGDVKARLYERVRAKGYDTLTAFAEARPAIPLHELADELGQEDVAAVQILSGLLGEAEQRKQVTRFVRDVLARELAEAFPDGWPGVLDDANRFEAAMALGRWSAYSPLTHEERVRQASDALLANPPPAGWRPLSHDDELLRTLLPDDTA